MDGTQQQADAEHVDPVTVVIGFRPQTESNERSQNLDAALICLGRQSLQRNHFRIVIVEQGPEPRLSESAKAAVDVYTFAYNPGPFNRSWGLNIGAKYATGGILCLFDADILVAPDFLSRCLLTWRCGVLAARPFSGMLYLDEAPSNEIREFLANGGRIEHHNVRMRGGMHPWNQGGCLWVDVALYHELGGHDERFEGWGDEDREFWERLSARTNIVMMQGVVLHLYHERSFEKGPEPRLNRKLHLAIQAGEIPRQSGEFGNPDRYRQAGIMG